MPTMLFQQLPWVGGLNSALDSALIPANQLTIADNIIPTTSGLRKRRPGINHDWDDVTAGDVSVIGTHEFWFGSSGTRTQKLVSVLADGTIYSTSSSGTRTTLTVGGAAWTGTLEHCSMLTFNNKVFIAVNGSTNTTKWWDGSPSSPVQDVVAYSGVPVIKRASAGTTKTLQFNAAAPFAVSSEIVVQGASNSTYNGTYSVASVSTTTIPDDTITYVATEALTEALTTDSGILAGGHAPKASILREYQGRIFCNDKAAADQLHYCSVANQTEWNGQGDSGAIPVRVGDGDPIGITGIFPAFRGQGFVAKKTKVYRLSGNTPETYEISTLSDSIGCESHNSITSIGTDDIMWVSEKGVHSLGAVQEYGDFTMADVSADIQTTFNDDFARVRLKHVWGAYLPQINTVAFTMPEESSRNRVNTTSSVNNAVYLYNIPAKQWLRWPDVPCQTITVANDLEKKRFYFGTHTGRISKALSAERYDTSSDGVATAIRFRIVTGVIVPDSNQYGLKAFKRFILFYRPRGRHNITVNVRVDASAVSAENSVSFSAASSASALGDGFILGSTPLGSTGVFGPYVRTIEGVGHGCTVTIEQTDLDAELEIAGFAIEYEPAIPAGA